MIPDHLSAEKNSPFFVQDMPQVRVSVNGVEYTGDVIEYCISAGWAKVWVKNGGDALRGKRNGFQAKMKRGKVVVWIATDPVPFGALADAVTA